MDDITKMTKDQLKEIGYDKLLAIEEKLKEAIWELKNEKTINELNKDDKEIKILPDHLL